MKKLSVLIVIGSMLVNVCFGQTRKNHSYTEIKKIIIGFLKKYKQASNDTTNYYDFIPVKGGYPDTATKVSVDKELLEKYLGFLKHMYPISDSFINNLRSYFYQIDKKLEAASKFKGPVKTGLETDVILGDEPGEVLNHIQESRFNKIFSIDHKAIAQLDISRSIKILFTLTKVDNKWLIDSINYIPFDH